MPHDDEARRLVASLRDREVAVHAERAAAPLVEDLDLHAGFFGERARGLGHERGRHLVRRLVRETPRHVHRVADRGPALDRAADGLLGDERDAVDLGEPPVVAIRAMHFRPPHRVDRALHRRLRPALLADARGGDGDGDAAHVRAPQRPDPRARDPAGALHVEVGGLARAHEDEPRLRVMRVDAEEPAGPALGLGDALDRRAGGARQPLRGRGVLEQRDDHGVDRADLRRTHRAELHVGSVVLGAWHGRISCRVSNTERHLGSMTKRLTIGDFKFESEGESQAPA